jgi:hypothetical protein
MYGVEPDMAMFGKALGNGYAITAIIGRREIMEAAQTTFISSTFWTERIGPTAALATLDVMSRTESWSQITKTGEAITQRWHELAKLNDLKITTGGLPSLTNFTFESTNALAYKTLITQEMLNQGFLDNCPAFGTKLLKGSPSGKGRYVTFTSYTSDGDMRSAISSLKSRENINGKIKAKTLVSRDDCVFFCIPVFTAPGSQLATRM